MFYQHHQLADHDFVSTSKFDVLITGVGMVATAFALGKHLLQPYDLVLNVGIAGSFDPEMKLGSLVQVETDTFPELGAEDHEKFIPINVLGFGENSYVSTAKIDGLPSVQAITVNKVHGNNLSISKTKRIFDVQIESMEGAAVFYATHKADVPCVQVRSISNYVEPRDKTRWNIGLAIQTLNDWLINFVNDPTGIEIRH